MPKPTNISLRRTVSILGLISALTGISHGQTVGYSIDLVLSGAPNTATYSKGDHFSAELILDQSSLSNKGSEVLIVGSGLESINFTFINGHRYTHVDDPSNGYPRAFFENGKLTGFDYWNSKGLTNGGAGSFFRFYKDGSFQYSPEGDSEFDGAYTHALAPVPEPSTSLMSLLGLGYFILLRRRSI